MTAERSGIDAPKQRAANGPGRDSAGNPHVADALRDAYQETVSEDVPPEFLELLGKLV